MEEPHRIQLDIKVPDNNGVADQRARHQPTTSQPKSLKWWIRILLYSFLILAGQSTCVLMGRLYFDKGGKSKWMATLVQFAGFPVLLPFYYIFPNKSDPKDEHPSVVKIGAVYLFLGLLITFNGIMYSIAILYLPVSTFSLITATQLAFTALFSFFLNGQKFTPYIVNSLVILTISSVLLVFHNESSNINGVSKGKYAVGFLCAVLTSAGSGLMLPLTQYFFQKVIKRDSFRAVFDMIVCELFVASCGAIVGLFASKEWKTLRAEMGMYKLGKSSYLMTLICTAIIWQVFYIGAIKMLVEVSSLFSNVIGTLGLPIVPVLAVFLFHDKMDGVKVVALAMAIWGFISYAYQCHLDNQASKARQEESM